MDNNKWLQTENETILVNTSDFEAILKAYQRADLESTMPIISKIVGDNYVKRCCTNCQHSLMCKIKDVVTHEMLIRADEYSCNLFMVNK